MLLGWNASFSMWLAGPWEPCVLHSYLVSCHHPLPSDPGLCSDTFPFLYSSRCFQPPRLHTPALPTFLPFLLYWPTFFSSPCGPQLIHIFLWRPSWTSKDQLISPSPWSHSRSHFPHNCIYHTESLLQVDVALDIPHTVCTHTPLTHLPFVKSTLSHHITGYFYKQEFKILTLTNIYLF